MAGGCWFLVGCWLVWFAVDFVYGFCVLCNLLFVFLVLCVYVVDGLFVYVVLGVFYVWLGC